MPRRIYDTLESRLGKRGSLAVMVLAGVAISVAATLAVHLIAAATVPPAAVMLAIVLPLAVAAPWSVAQIGLRARLDDAEERLQRTSITDELTGAYSRRHFLHLAALEMARAERYGEVFSLVLIDIDAFASVNARWGRAVGDQVLRTVAGVCSAACRKTDTFARLEGARFVYLLPCTAPSGAEQAAERVRRLVAKMAVKTPTDMVTVTVSAGVAGIGANDQEIEHILARAEDALYIAKRAGKNRVACA